jgi:glutamate carboxypeptidase
MNELIAHMDEKEPEMLAFLEQLVNQDSDSLDKAGVDRVGDLLARRLEELGFSVERVRQQERGDHLVARKPGTGKETILFLGHMDTVFPSGTAAARPFRIEGSRAYGPGVLDMKGGLTVLLYALEALKSTDNPAFEVANMVAVFNSDEELLSPTSRPIIEAEARRAQTVCVFEPARPGGEYVVARKGVGKYWLTVHGRAAHAGSQPDRGRSAIGEMAHKIVALHALTNLDVGTTVNVGVVHGGERSNVVAERAYAEIDLRVPDSAEAERADASIREIAGASTVPDTTAELSGGISFPPMVTTPKAQKLFEAVQAAGRQLGLDLRGVSTGGGSDGNYASQYAPTVDGMGPRGSEAHSDREFVEIPTLVERAKVAALFLAAWPETIQRL